MLAFSEQVTRHTEQRCSMVQFLRRLLNIFRESAPESPQQDKVAASEQIARYILSKRQFSASNRTVKYGAYLPAPDGETSVYRISNLSDDAIWTIGQEYVAKSSSRSLYGRGDTAAEVIMTTGLDLIINIVVANNWTRD